MKSLIKDRTARIIVSTMKDSEAACVEVCILGVIKTRAASTNSYLIHAEPWS